MDGYILPYTVIKRKLYRIHLPRSLYLMLQDGPLDDMHCPVIVTEPLHAFISL